MADRVLYICENAPAYDKAQADGHTAYTINYSKMNGAGIRWSSELRIKTCAKCGGRVLGRTDWRNHWIELHPEDASV